MAVRRSSVGDPASRDALLHAAPAVMPTEATTGTARVVEGRADTPDDDVLTPDEIAEGWVLTARPCR